MDTVLCLKFRKQPRLETLERRDAPAVFTVTTSADTGTGSLRQAITDANKTPGADTIRFAIGTGAQTIAPATALPAITDTVTLDATTQAGYAGQPLIALDGSATPVGSSGLTLSNHTGSTIRGFVIQNFSKDYTGSFIDAAGINIRNGGSHTIQGNRIGTDAAGSVSKPNGYAGIMINNSADNQIGGTTAAARNVIAGNRAVGVYIVNPLAVGNRVQGNIIGADATGTAPLPNGNPSISNGGVLISGFGGGSGIPAGNNLIGGAEAGAGNLIANERFGVQIVGSTGNRILGNALSNNGTAIFLDTNYRPNDAADADTGANNWQNHPTITGVTTNGSTTTVSGTLNSTPNSRFRIELFRSTTRLSDYWGNGQGQTFLTALEVTTDASGNATFSTPLPAQPAGAWMTATATNLASGDSSVVSKPFGVPASVTSGTGGYLVAAASGSPRVWQYKADGTLQRTFLAYDAAFAGGVHAVLADVTGDGVPDIITAPGTGGGPHVKIFDGATGNPFSQFMAFDPAFRGGVNLAAADMTGDGKAEIITAAGAGGGPHVRIFDGARAQVLKDFFAYHPRFTGGVSVAVGDVDGDGTPDIVTGAGANGGPHVRVWRGVAAQPLREFMAYSQSYFGGVNVAVGDFDGNGKADIATAPIGGMEARLRVFDLDAQVLKELVISNDNYRGGMTLTARDIDADGAVEILTAVKANGKPKLTAVHPQGALTDMPADPLAPESVNLG